MKSRRMEGNNARAKMEERLWNSWLLRFNLTFTTDIGRFAFSTERTLASSPHVHRPRENQRVSSI